MISIKVVKKMEHFTINFEAAFASGVLVVQGESGAGKTTILDCIAGLRQPEYGTIEIDGKVCFSKADNVDLPAKDRDIGYVFQSYALFPHMTVLQNIIFGQKCRQKEDMEYIERLMNSFHIEHLKGKHPSQISGGEKQRTALARALAIKPRLLLLDEPFSALDNKTKYDVYEEFQLIRSKLNFNAILVTHNEKEAKLLGDSIIAIKDGKRAELEA